jgi:hypothetical protein
MSDKIDIAAFERDRDRMNLEFEREQRETEWRKQFEQKLKEEVKMFDALKEAKPSWQEDLKPVLDTVVSPRIAQGVRTPVSMRTSEPTRVLGGDSTASAGYPAPFAFIGTEDLDGGIYYNSKLYTDTSLTAFDLSGVLQSADRTTGNFTVSENDNIYLEIEQDADAEIIGVERKCDATWDGTMFELDSGGDYIQFIRIKLHEVITDDSSGDNRPGVVVSDGSTTLKVARVWSGDIYSGDYFVENGLLTHKALRYGG